MFGGGCNNNNLFRKVALSTLDVYNNTDDTFAALTTLSVPRYNLASASTNAIGIFAGGLETTFSGRSVFSDAVDLYFLTTNRWMTCSLSVARSSLAGASVNGLILFGGGAVSGGISDRVDIYNSITSTWSTSKIHIARSELSAASVDCLVIFAGGSVSYAVDIFDSSSAKWSTAVLAFGGSNLGVVAIGLTIIIAGSTCEHSSLTSVSYIRFCSAGILI